MTKVFGHIYDYILFFIFRELQQVNGVAMDINGTKLFRLQLQLFQLLPTAIITFSLFFLTPAGHMTLFSYTNYHVQHWYNGKNSHLIKSGSCGLVAQW